MSPTEHPETFGRMRLSFADEKDVDEFVATLERYERGEIGADEWRTFRLVRGAYGQRQADLTMLRVKIPQGVLNAGQLQALAQVSEKHSRGFGHITTRQNLQFHFMKLSDAEKAMRTLAEVGLTTREACGNSVRNITACPYAGVSRDERFDVTPYAEALTRYLLRHPLSSTLPRKFKIAFEGCPEDHVFTPIHDIGWRAVERQGLRGFKVTVGGGTATVWTSGWTLYEFLPASAMLDVVEAVLRVFHRLGDRKRKHRARMKFLVRKLGFERWRAAFEEELAGVRRESGDRRLPFDPDRPPEEGAPDWNPADPPAPSDVAARASAGEVRGPGISPEVRTNLDVANEDIERWARTNVRLQKQEGYALAIATVPLGDLTGAQMRVLADLARAYGDGAIRVTPQQDLVFRWIRRENVPELYRRLAGAGLGRGNANTIADVTSCPGAESCRLAVTQSRGLGRLLGEHLAERPDLVAAAPDLSIKISGCPNGCGQHQIAGLGLQGSIHKVGARVAPQYFVMLGGGVDDDGAHFARLVAKIPARRAPAALEGLIALYRAERRDGETAADFFRRVETEPVRAALGKLTRLDEESALPEDFIDIGEDHEYKPETQDGECAA